MRQLAWCNFFIFLTFWLLAGPRGGLLVQLCQGTRPLAIHFHNVVSERTTKARHSSTARTLPSLFHAVRFACCRQLPGRPKCHAPKKAKAKVHSAVNNFSISLYPSSSNFFWHQICITNLVFTYSKVMGSEKKAARVF